MDCSTLKDTQRHQSGVGRERRGKRKKVLDPKRTAFLPTKGRQRYMGATIYWMHNRGPEQITHLDTNTFFIEMY